MNLFRYKVYVLYVQSDLAESSIMLVKNFR